MVGILVILFGIFGLFSAAAKPDISQNQVILRGFPYTLVLISGYGILFRKSWARLLIASISVLGLALQIFEISMAPNLKDIIEALLFSFFILFFTVKPIKMEFNS